MGRDRETCDKGTSGSSGYLFDLFARAAYIAQDRIGATDECLANGRKCHSLCFAFE